MCLCVSVSVLNFGLWCMPSRCCVNLRSYFLYHRPASAGRSATIHYATLITLITVLSLTHAMMKCVLVTLLVFYLFHDSHSNSGGDVRLVGGPNEFEGRVEVYVGGVWARWCYPGGSINRTTVRVVCRQLGHDEGGVWPHAYGIGNELSAISNISCQGTENKITECMHTNTTAADNCNDVGLYCRDPTCDSDGEVRLTDNTTSTEGRVEICQSGFRAGLCYENFTRKAARVLCRQLGLSTSNASGSETGAIPYLRGISTSNCTGDEIGFDQCQPMPAVFQSCSRVRLNCPESRRGDSTEEDTSGSRSASTDIATTSTTASTSNGTAASTADNVADPPNVVAIILGVVCGVLVLLLLCGGIFLALILRNKCSQVSLNKTEMEVTREKITAIDQSSGPEYEEIPHLATDDAVEMIVTAGNKAYETVSTSILTKKNLAYESVVAPSTKVEEGDDGDYI